MSNKTNSDKIEFSDVLRQTKYGLISVSVALLPFVIANRYKISKPNEVIAKTGLFINGISVKKNTFLFPLQSYQVLDLTPINYTFDLKAMSREKMDFELPGVFTIAPDNESIESVQLYAQRFAGTTSQERREIVEGVIEGGARSLAANLDLEEIFRDRTKFKNEIQVHIAEDLKPFGLVILNANIKELQDTEQNKYFSILRQRTVENAINQAKVDVAEATKIGDIGEKEKQTETRKQVAIFEADAVTIENERKQQIRYSEAELRKREAILSREIEVAEIEAKMFSALREQELEREVQMKRLEQETERLRAIDMSRARVEAETLIKLSEGKAEAIKIQAAAEAETLKMKAEAKLYEELKKAEAMRAKYEAEASGLDRMTQSCGGDFNNVLQHFMIQEDMYTKLAAKNAEAIRGLSPKITVWNTSNSGKDQANPIGDIFKNLPPLLSTIKEQTGMSLPDWAIKMPQTTEENDKK